MRKRIHFFTLLAIAFLGMIDFVCVQQWRGRQSSHGK